LARFDKICRKIVVSALKLKIGKLNLPAYAARKLPIPIEASARGRVLSRNAEIHDFRAVEDIISILPAEFHLT
jgi:hypothetical protein